MGITLLWAALVWAFVVSNIDTTYTPPEVERLRALFDQDLAEFAQLLDDSLLHCDPALCGEDYRDNQKMFRDLAGRGGHGYHPIADSLLPDCQKQLIADTVTIVWREGMGRGVTASAGYYRDDCNSWSVCEITPSDSAFPLPGWHEATLILREGVEPPRSFRSYEQVNMSGEHIKAFQDSIGKIFADIPPSPECMPEIANVHFDYFVPNDNANQDTLFATAHGGQCEYIGRWQAVYLMTRSDNHWSWTPVIDVRKGPWVFTISCSFDLNSDGLPEFLVWEKTHASLYTLVNGRFVWFASAREHPC